MRILAIETSCDETGVCLLEARQDGTYHVLGNALYSQVAVHAPYGGVYPNLAKREHSVNLVPVLIECLADAGELAKAAGDAPDIESVRGILEREPELCAELASFVKLHAAPQIDAIAVTHGPGLEPALWVGVNFARSLSILWNVPVVPVNHMEGHIIMPMMRTLDDTGRTFALEEAAPPLLALLVSGGHTELVLSREPHAYEIIGETRDDAAGEAFDKVARLLGLPYPGGPEISRLAAQARARGEDCRYVFPRPMLYSGDYDFSFSGLKTELRKHVQSLDELTDDTRMHTARAFEDAVVDTLVHKTAKAADEHGVQTVVLGGGVSANTHLRTQLKDALDARSITLLVPPPALSTDNAVMIALAGALRAAHGAYADPATLRAQGHLRLA